MHHIILASHSNLARGMYDSLRFFNNDINNVKYICAYEDGLDFEATLRSAIATARTEHIIVLTDMLTGSVTQIAMKLTREFPIRVISGMNLAMLLALVYEENNFGSDELNNIIEAGKKSICYVNDMQIDDTPDDL
jgi:mannose/fructose-specific phosphotransferase system component IIA